MRKPAIQLSDQAVRTINELLSEGKRVSVDVNRKTNELMIREEHSKLKYRVIVSEGKQ